MIATSDGNHLNQGRSHPEPFANRETANITGNGQLRQQGTGLSKWQKQADIGRWGTDGAQQPGQHQLGAGHLFRQFRGSAVEHVHDVILGQRAAFGIGNGCAGPIVAVVTAQDDIDPFEAASFRSDL